MLRTKVRIYCYFFLQHPVAANRWDGFGMFSADGEYVEFSASVLLEGPIELWLCKIGWYIYLVSTFIFICLLHSHKNQTNSLYL